MADTNGHSSASPAYSASVTESMPYDRTRSATYDRVRTRTYDDKPLSDLFQDLAEEGRRLFELEMALAKSEMSQKASQAGKDVSYMAGGGFVMYAGFLTIIAAVVLVLTYFIPMWLSALIVGIVVALIGYVLLRRGQGDLKKVTLAPERTVNSLKRDVSTVKQEASATVTGGGS